MKQQIQLTKGKNIMSKLNIKLESLVEQIRSKKDKMYIKKLKSKFKTKFYFIDTDIIEAGIKFVYNNRDLLDKFIKLELELIEGDEYGTFMILGYINDDETIDFEFKTASNILIWSDIKVTTFRKFFSINDFNIGEENND